MSYLTAARRFNFTDCTLHQRVSPGHLQLAFSTTSTRFTTDSKLSSKPGPLAGAVSLPPQLSLNPCVRAITSALSVQIFGTRSRRDGQSRITDPKNGPEWHKLAGPGWLARPSTRRQNAKTPRLSPIWIRIARVVDWLAPLPRKACQSSWPWDFRSNPARGRKEARGGGWRKAFYVTLSFRGSIGLGLGLSASLFSARQHPHRFSTDGYRRPRNWHLTTKSTGRCHSHDFGGIESETGVAGTTRQGPIHLAEPSLVSLEAGQCNDYNGRLVDEMPSPPESNMLSPPRAPSSRWIKPIKPAPLPHGGGGAPEHPKRPSAGLPPLVALQSVAPGTASVKRGG